MRTDLISPSPNAVSLGKFGVVPVSIYTGIPDISIPLGEASGKEISLPVSVNYHHTGLKSYEQASWVGLGWSLNAGGVITRIIKDKLDETNPTGYRYQDIDANFKVEGVSQTYLDGSMFSGTYDTEPDMYAFNFAGYSGKFIIYNGQTYQFPYQKLKITGSPTAGFSIVTPEGTTYTFNEAERSEPKNDQNSTYTVPNHNSSWYMSRVQSANQKETITLGYSAGNEIYMHSPTSQMYQAFQSGAGGNSVLGAKKAPLPMRVYAKHLTSISTSKMTINFISQSSPRSDIPADYALDRVTFSDASGTIKTIKFNYGYFGAGGGGLTTLKLVAVDEQDSNYDTNLAKRHSFSYNESSGWTVQSEQVDHWGYVNGAYNTSSVIIPNSIYTQGMNREPDVNYTSMGMLRKIVYPTGGSSVFTFEPNIYGGNNEYQVKYLSADNFINRSSSVDNKLLSNKTSFTLIDEQDVKIFYSRVPKDPVNTAPPNGPDDPTKDIDPEISVGFGSVSRVADVNAAAISLPVTYKILYNRDNSGMSTTLHLMPGAYEVTLFCDSKEMSTAFHLGYFVKTNIPIEGKKGPGLRIKQIDSYATADEKLSPVLTKKYSYVNGGGFSTCRLSKGVSYGGKPYSVMTFVGTSLVTYNYLLYSSYINSALGDLIDQDYYYYLVNEYQYSPTSDLRTQYEFTSASEGNIYWGTGVKPTRQIDYKKVGADYVPVRKQEYDYSYKAGETRFFSALKPYQTIQKVPSGGNGFPDPLRVYEYDYYSLVPSIWHYNTTEREVSYVGTDSLVTTKVYLNDLSKKLNVKGVKTIDSRGQERIVKYKYPEDYAPAISQAFIDKHVLSPVFEQQNWLKRPAGDSVLLSGKIDSYDASLFKPVTSYLLETGKPIALPDQESKDGSGLYTTLLSDSHYKPGITYSYDATTGNLVSQDLLNSTTAKQVVYMWGYHNSTGSYLYPVAECKNGAIGDFFYTGFEDGGTNVQTGTGHTGVSYYAGNYVLGFAIPNSSLKYLYSYWYRSAGVWNYSGELSYTGAVTLTGEAFDDIRVYPSNGQMTTYTYLTTAGISSITDVKGKSTYFEYDAAQRLKTSKDQNGNIISTNEYHYIPITPIVEVPVTCTGEGRKIVNGVCQMGFKAYDGSTYNPATQNYTCTYHYEWTDGTRSIAYTEPSTVACLAS